MSSAGGAVEPVASSSREAGNGAESEESGRNSGEQAQYEPCQIEWKKWSHLSLLSINIQRA